MKLMQFLMCLICCTAVSAIMTEIRCRIHFRTIDEMLSNTIGQVKSIVNGCMERIFGRGIQ